MALESVAVTLGNASAAFDGGKRSGTFWGGTFSSKTDLGVVVVVVCDGATGWTCVPAPLSLCPGLQSDRAGHVQWGTFSLI